MKNIKIAIIALIAISFSCSKEDNGTMDESSSSYVLNTHRVKSITYISAEGEGVRTADFVYDGKNLSARRIDYIIETDTLGGVLSSVSTSQAIYTIGDNVANISPDDIEDLDAELLSKYGEGNYSLTDSIPKVYRVRHASTLTISSDGDVIGQKHQLYNPRENLVISGTFNNFYTNDDIHRYIYEYDNAGNISVCRLIKTKNYFTDSYVSSSSEVRNFMYEMTYSNNKLTSFIEYEAVPGNSYTKIEEYTYKYDGNRILSITGDVSYKKEYKYSGNTCVITENGIEVLTYELGPSDYPVKITDIEGNVTIIEYEEGHGDYQSFTLFNDKIFGIPYIR